MIYVINNSKGTFTHNSKCHFVDIMRPSILSNPFIIGKDGNRNKVIDKFKRYLYDEYQSKDSEIHKEINKLVNVSNFGDIFLVCCCKPKRCHGDIIKELIESIQFVKLF